MINLQGKIVYLAGPISKVEWGVAKQRFMELEEKTSKYLPQRIYNPINHLKPPYPMDEMETWAWFMRQSVRDLSMCDAIVLMDNYMISKGARLEKYLASELGVEIYNEKDL
jgi:nucleoside 2-deoxyribosyltransferase